MSVLLILGGRRAEGGAPVGGQGAPLAPGQGEAPHDGFPAHGIPRKSTFLTDPAPS